MSVRQTKSEKYMMREGFMVLIYSTYFSCHRVVTTRIEWITAQHPPECHQASFNQPMLINSLVAVMGAARVKAAGIDRQSR